MKRQARYSTLSEALKEAIAESPESVRSIAAATDLEHSAVSRFVRGITSLRLDLADRLAQYFGIEMTRRKEGK